MPDEDPPIRNRQTDPGPGDETRIVSIPPMRPEQGTSGGTLVPGAVLNHTYRIEGLLARGGMGEIYRAAHVELQTEHAIKVIRPELADNSRVLEMFRREATSLRNVRNDAVVAYDGVFRDEDGRLYLVMEFVSGPPLSDIVRQGPVAPADVGILLERLAAGLAAAHDKGIVHRDMSPDNVILPDRRIDRAKIIDFGIAKLTDPDQATVIGNDFAGKYSFVSPEQLGMFGGQVNQCSDIYSLGLVLAAAALGRPLDMGNSHASIIEARREAPDLSEIGDPDLRRVLTAMLQPDPANRPESMRALIASAGPVAVAAPSIRQGPTPLPGAGRTGGRRRGLAAALAAVLLLALAAGGGFWLLNRDRDQRVAQSPPPLLSVEAGNTRPGENAGAGESAATPIARETPPIAEANGISPTPAKMSRAQTGEKPPPEIAARDQPTAESAQAPPAQPSLSRDEMAEPAHPTPTSRLGDQIAALPTAPAIAPAARPGSEQALKAVLSEFSCANLVLTQGADGARIEGFVASRDDLKRLRTEVGAIDGSVAVEPNIHEWPFCAALRILETRTAFEGPDAPVLQLNKSEGRYVAGDRLRVDATTSSRSKGYLYVVYLMSDGTAAYLLPMPLRPSPAVAAGSHIVLGEERDYRIGPPFGRDMILAVWSDKPLALDGRPEVEPAKDFIAALEKAVEPKIVGQPRLASAYTYLVSRPSR